MDNNYLNQRGALIVNRLLEIIFSKELPKFLVFGRRFFDYAVITSQNSTAGNFNTCLQPVTYIALGFALAI